MPATQVQAPDGQTIEFPDSMDNDAIGAAMRKLYPLKAAGPAPQPDMATRQAAIEKVKAAEPAPTMGPEPQAKTWDDVSLADPFRGGIKGMASRTIPYLKGEAQDIKEGIMGIPGAIKGMVKAGVDVGGAVQGDPTSMVRAGKDVMGGLEGLGGIFTKPLESPETMTDPKKFTTEVGDAAMLATPSGAASIPEDISAVKGAMAPDLAKNVAGTLADAQVSTQGLLQKGEDAYASKIFDKTDAIRKADAAKPTKFDMTPVADAYKNLREGIRGTNLANLPHVQQAINVVKKAATKGPMNFETLQQLRTDIGNLTYSHTIPKFESKLLGGLYTAATDVLGKRAGELGMTPEFEAYNKEFSSLMDLRKTTLNKLKTLDPKSSGFFKKLTDTKDVRVQNMLDRFEEAAPGVGKEIRKILADTKPLQRVQEGSRGSMMGGRWRAIKEHPMTAIPAAMAGGALGTMTGIPMGGFLGGTLAATEAAKLSEKIAAARALGKIAYPEGHKLLKTGMGGMLPKQ